MSGPKRYVTRVRGARESVPVDIAEQGGGEYVLAVRGRTHTVDARVLDHGAVSLLVDGRSYDVELDESVLKMAHEGVVAHLVKLEREGRARREGDAWHIMDT